MSLVGNTAVHILLGTISLFPLGYTLATGHSNCLDHAWLYHSTVPLWQIMGCIHLCITEAHYTAGLNILL